MRKKYIVIGLGNFGYALSARLTQLGHEVIGVDSNLHKVEQFKNEITSTICLDACDTNAVKMLPLDDADAIIVAIGEDFGASVQATATLKQLKVKRLVSRAISALHRTVLEAIGVDEILNPEKISADILSNSLHFEGAKNSYLVDMNHVVLEVPVLSKYWDSTLDETGFTERFNIQIICVKKPVSGLSIFRKSNKENIVAQNITNSYTLKEGDTFVLFGSIEAFEKMFKMDQIEL